MSRRSTRRSRACAARPKCGATPVGGNPFAQRLAQQPSYKGALSHLAQLDVDVVTIEAAENNGAEIADVAAALGSDRKICIGVLSHRSLQVKLLDDIAALIRKALKSVPAERLLLSSTAVSAYRG